MTHGWLNLKEREHRLREYQKHCRQVGYSDGYALLAAKSREAYYQAGWRAGRTARQEFDRDNLLNDLDEAS